MAKGTGSVKQLKNSIYKLTQFPGGCMNKFYRNPQGTLKIERREHSVFVTCGEQYKVECFDDYSWHIMADTLDGEYKADLWHRACGYPLWYGREKPSYLTQHSITYGYNWAGKVDGWLELNATREHFSLCPIREGQEVLIVIGEGLAPQAIAGRLGAELPV